MRVHKREKNPASCVPVVGVIILHVVSVVPVFCTPVCEDPVVTATACRPVVTMSHVVSAVPVVSSCF